MELLIAASLLSRSHWIYCAVGPPQTETNTQKSPANSLIRKSQHKLISYFCLYIIFAKAIYRISQWKSFIIRRKRIQWKEEEANQSQNLMS